VINQIPGFCFRSSLLSTFPRRLNSDAAVHPSPGGAPHHLVDMSVTADGSVATAPQVVLVHPCTAVNVKTHIPVTLEMKNPNFTKWASFFKALCGKFSLLPHISESAAPPVDDPSWPIAECTVCGWILNTVDDSVLDLAITDENQTARELWVAIEALFRSNRAPRAVFLLEEFHSLRQGDSTIDEYCQKLKVKAAALWDVGETIDDKQLVLSLLCGLNPRFSATADDIANATVLPSFPGRARCSPSRNCASPTTRRPRRPPLW
jgi:hypothetical protein